MDKITRRNIISNPKKFLADIRDIETAEMEEFFIKNIEKYTKSKVLRKKIFYSMKTEESQRENEFSDIIKKILSDWNKEWEKLKKTKYLEYA